MKLPASVMSFATKFKSSSRKTTEDSPSKSGPEDAAERQKSKERTRHLHKVHDQKEYSRKAAKYEKKDTEEVVVRLEKPMGVPLGVNIARREKLSEEDARKIFQQIISSIEYSHQDKIAHRDLKPEDLLLDDQNNIRLIDFGLANIMRDSLALKTACGSPNYAAPEVISGMSYGGAEVDIWSCGVILYAMVCGSLPFDDDHMPQLFNKIKECRYYIPGHLSPAVQDLINRMLQPNPVKRISLQEI